MCILFKLRVRMRLHYNIFKGVEVEKQTKGHPVSAKEAPLSLVIWLRKGQ